MLVSKRKRKEIDMKDLSEIKSIYLGVKKTSLDAWTYVDVNNIDASLKSKDVKAIHVLTNKITSGCTLNVNKDSLMIYDHFTKKNITCNYRNYIFYFRDQRCS